MKVADVECFLTSLALDGNVSASTQNQAFNALLFLYREILEIELDEIDSFRAKEPDRLPVVCTWGDENYPISGDFFLPGFVPARGNPHGAGLGS